MNKIQFQNDKDNKIYITASKPFTEGGMGLLYQAKKLRAKEYTECFKTWDGEHVNAAAYSGRNFTESQIIEELDRIFSQSNFYDIPIPFLGNCYDDKTYRGFLTPYVEAKTIFDLIVDINESCDPEVAEDHKLDLCVRLIDLLDRIHNHGFIHRDIKPDNFLIEGTYKDFRIYIIDFGLAKDLNSRVQQVESARTTLNTGGGGTPGYAPFEQCVSLSDSKTTQSDQFSIAMLVFTILNNGDHPFGNNLNSQDWIDTLDETFASSVRFHPLFEPYHEMQECLCIALSKEPRRRYSSTSDFRDAFIYAVDKIKDKKKVVSVIPTRVSNGQIILWNQLPDGSAFPEIGTISHPLYDIRNDTIVGRHYQPIQATIQHISVSGRLQKPQLVKISQQHPIALDSFALSDGDAIDITPKDLQQGYLSRYIYKAIPRNHQIFDRRYASTSQNSVQFISFCSRYKTQIAAYVVTTNVNPRILDKVGLRWVERRNRQSRHPYFEAIVEYNLYDDLSYFVLFDTKTQRIINIYKCSQHQQGANLVLVYGPNRNNFTNPATINTLQQLLFRAQRGQRYTRLWPFHDTTRFFVQQLYDELNALLPASTHLTISTNWKNWIAAYRLIQVLKENLKKVHTQDEVDVLYHNMSYHLLHKNHIDILPLKRSDGSGFAQTILSQNTLKYDSKAGVKFRFEYTKDLDFPSFKNKQTERISGAKRPQAEVFYIHNSTLFHIVLHDSDQLSCGQWSSIESQKNHFPLLLSTLTPFSVFYLQQNSEYLLNEIEPDLISYPQNMKNNPLIKAEIFDPMFARFCEQCRVHLRFDQKTCTSCARKTSTAPSNTTLNLRKKYTELFGTSISIEENHGTLYSFQVCSSWISLHKNEVFLFMQDGNVHIQSTLEPIMVNGSSLPKGVSRMVTSDSIKYKGTRYRIIIH